MGPPRFVWSEAISAEAQRAELLAYALSPAGCRRTRQARIAAAGVLRAFWRRRRLPVGAITLGGSVGDAGHRKIFFTFGRLF